MEYRTGRGLYAIVGSGELGVVRRRSKYALDFVDGLQWRLRILAFGLP